MNKNAQRSVRLLEQAYLSLLAEKPYTKITVTDVANKAGLNRGTFYAHFKGMPELTERVMDDLSQRLVEIVRSQYEGDFAENPRPTLAAVGGFFSENRDVMLGLEESSSFMPLASSLVDRLEEWFRGYVGERNPDDGLTDLVLVHYMFAGIVSAYHGWVRGEMGDCPVEEVNERLVRLVVASCAAFGRGDRRC